jgi:Fe-S-cluster containining protein
MEWLGDAIPESLFPQVAAQSLFECCNCSECCRGEGYALLDEEDMQRIAQELGLSLAEAMASFTDPDPKRRKGSMILKSKGRERSCCFLDKKTRLCSIYDSRPRVCRTFPLLNLDPECGDIICLYPDCLGTAKFVKMLREKSRDTAVKRDVKELKADALRIADLRLMLYVRLQQIAGNAEEARRILRITEIELPPQEEQFRRDCLAFFLMTINTEGLEGYRYEGGKEMALLSPAANGRPTGDLPASSERPAARRGKRKTRSQSPRF